MKNDTGTANPLCDLRNGNRKVNVKGVIGPRYHNQCCLLNMSRE